MVSGQLSVLGGKVMMMSQVWSALSPGDEGQDQGRRARGVTTRGGEDPGAHGQRLDGER